MAEQPREIEQEIEEQRQHLAQHLAELQLKVEEAADWRTYVWRKPGVLAAVAITACVVLAVVLIRK